MGLQIPLHFPHFLSQIDMFFIPHELLHPRDGGKTSPCKPQLVFPDTGKSTSPMNHAIVTLQGEKSSH